MNARKYNFRHLKRKLYKKGITKNPSSLKASNLKLPHTFKELKFKFQGD
jgi:hypothetical protein